MSVPSCPICDARDADHIPDERGYHRPWGKPWYCRLCDFVYGGSAEERTHWEVREQRLRWRNMRDAQARQRALSTYKPPRDAA
jgi:hypothetical protein